MNNRVKLALLVGAGALFCALLAVRQGRDRAPVRSLQPLPEPAAHARERVDPRVDALSREVSRLASMVQTLKAGGPLAPAGDTQPAGQRKAPQSVSEAEHKRRLEQRIALLNRTLESERDDPAWTDNATRRLEHAYALPELEGVTIDVLCRTTLCRSEFTFDPEGEFETQGAKMVVTLAPWPAQGFMKLDPDAGRATFYLAREATPLPRPAEDMLARSTAASPEDNR